MKKFKLLTILGIRPDLIRMAKLIRLLDEGQEKYEYEHIFAHSGQHFDFELDEVFYTELNIRKPDMNLGIGRELKESGRTGPAYQSGLLLKKVDELVENIKPDAVMYLGDTNTVTSALSVAKKNIPVIHIEGGGRSFDWRMPEEKNRILIDHLSDMIYVYLDRYKALLMNEGIEDFRVKVIGNIIVDAIEEFLPLAEKSNILDDLKLEKNKYILCTIHREENTENEDIFRHKIADLIKISGECKVVFPVMPRVMAKIEKYKLSDAIKNSNILQTKPLGFLDFLKMEKDAKFIITDSGTVQEEAAILGVPCLVCRRSTERPETIKAGATILADENLYDNFLKLQNLSKDWDRNILNPEKGSPSERVFGDFIKKVQQNFFAESREFSFIKGNKFVREAYNKNEQ